MLQRFSVLCYSIIAFGKKGKYTHGRRGAARIFVSDDGMCSIPIFFSFHFSCHEEMALTHITKSIGTHVLQKKARDI